MVIGKIGKFLKEYKSKIVWGILIIIALLLFFIFPIQESITPSIVSVENEIMQNMTFVDTQGVVFIGNNLNKIEKVYVNGVQDKECSIVSKGDYSIVVHFGKDFLKDSGEKKIQFVSTIGGVYTIRSNIFSLVVEKNTEKVPVITNISKKEILRTQGKQNLQINVTNLTNESRLYINDSEEASAVYDIENGIISFDVLPSLYGTEELAIQIYNDRNGYHIINSEKHVLKLVNNDWKSYIHTTEFAENNKVIMHAGGMWNGHVYTNCQEAFEYNYQKGCKAFEIDLSMTSDGVIVGRHDWSDVMYSESIVAKEQVNFEEYKWNSLPKTYKEVCEMYKDRTPLTWEKLVNYMLQDDDLYIITDTKYTNTEAVAYMFTKMLQTVKALGAEEVLPRIAVQIYNQDMYATIMNIYPFPTVIYTLYQSADDNQAVLDFVEQSNVRIITLAGNSNRDTDDFVQKLKEKGCYVYAHTINDKARTANYLERGFAGVYTDVISVDVLAEIEADQIKLNEVYLESVNLEAQENVENNKKYLLNYLSDINNDNYIVLLSVTDEGTRMVDSSIAEALHTLGVSEQYSAAFGSGYIGIMSNGEKIYEEFSKEFIEHTWIDQDTGNVFKISSAGQGLGKLSSILVNGSEYVKYDTLKQRGLHIVVFDKNMGLVVSSITVDLYEGLDIVE